MDWLIKKIHHFDSRSFLANNNRIVHYSVLSQAIKDKKKHFIESGIEPADIVILKGDYTLEAIASLLALLQLKAIVAPVAVDAENEQQQRIEASKAQWLVQTHPQTRISFKITG